MFVGLAPLIEYGKGQARSDLQVLSKVEARAPGKQFHHRDLFEFGFSIAGWLRRAHVVL